MNELKKLLKTAGFLVEVRNGERALCMPYKNECGLTKFTLDFFNGDSIDIEKYEYNLRYPLNEIYDIMYIYGYSSSMDSTFENSTVDRSVVWERKTALKIGDKVFVKTLEHTKELWLNKSLVEDASKFSDWCFDLSILDTILLNEFGTIYRLFEEDGTCILNFELERTNFINAIANGFLISCDDLELIE